MTIVEVLIALLVLTAGLLGTASAAGAAARLIADGERLTRFAATASGLLEELRDAGCAAADGARQVEAFAFRWTVYRDAGLAEVRLIGTHETAAGPRRIMFVLARWCP